MKNHRLVALMAVLLFCAHGAWADDPKASRDQRAAIASALKYQTNDINLQNGLAKVSMPKEFKFLGPEDTETVLVKLWGNPPGSKPLGMLLPADKTPLDRGCWVVMFSYEEGGYVKDNDANKINYDDLLKTMQKDAREASKQRVKEGYAGVELVGWATPPRYDAATHKLYWAKELKFDDEKEHTLNYNIRILGRRGVLVLNAIASMDQLSQIEQQTPQILSMVNFNDGNRYADFDPKVDKVATYGIAALVAGGIAAKLGFFKLLWVGILALKKFIIIGIVAISAWLKKIFGKKGATPAPPSTPST